MSKPTHVKTYPLSMSHRSRRKPPHNKKMNRLIRTCSIHRKSARKQKKIEYLQLKSVIDTRYGRSVHNATRRREAETIKKKNLNYANCVSRLSTGPSGDNGFDQTTKKSSVNGTCAHFSSKDHFYQVSKKRQGFLPRRFLFCTLCKRSRNTGSLPVFYVLYFSRYSPGVIPAYLRNTRIKWLCEEKPR